MEQMGLKGCVNGCFFGLLILLLSIFIAPKNSYSQNLPPLINQGIPNQHAEVGSDFLYPISNQAFRDENYDFLSITTSPLPGWLIFDPAKNEFRGTPDATGTFPILVTATDPFGLTVSTSFQITVHPEGTTYAAFTMNTSRGCDFQLVQFENKSKGAVSQHWILGNTNESDSINPSAIYNEPGTYTVTLTINGGGAPELSHTEIITIFPRPEAVLSATPNTGCAPLDADVSSTHTGGSYYTWYFYDKLPAATTFEPNLKLSDLPGGNYNGGLKITDGNGCQSNVYAMPLITVNGVPNPSFTYKKDDPCRPSTVEFTNHSTVEGTYISDYEWTVNGVPLGTDKDFSYTFSSYGEYVVGLQCESALGCRSELYTEIIRFNETNTIDFSFENQCLGDTTRFVSVASPNIAGYEWDLDGNGVPDYSGANPEYQFPDEGRYSTALTATFDDGCVLTVTKPVDIEKINASFSQEFVNHCPPNYSVRFTDQSTSNLNSNIVARRWYLSETGQDENLVSQDASFVYNFGAGVYSIRLEVESSFGCSNSTSQLVDLSPPTMTLAVSGKLMGCIDGTQTSFSVSFNKEGDPASTWSWNFGDGQTGSGPTPTHIYSQPGQFDVGVTIQTDKGCTYYRQLTAAVKLANPPVITRFEDQRLTHCFSEMAALYTEFSAGTDSLGFTLPGSPDHASVATSGLSNLYSYAFPDIGTFDITVVAYDNGCPSDPETLDNLEVVGPKAYFSLAETAFCNGPSTVSFSNQSSADAGTVFTWDFGDGSLPLISSDPTVSHNYSSTGSYRISLTAQSLNGCSHVYHEDIDLYSFDNAPGIISADKLQGCAPLDVSFSQNIKDRLSPNYHIKAFLWDLDGDGFIDSDEDEENPVFTYVRPGLFSVRLTVQGENGCVYSFSEENMIRANGPVPDFSYTQPVCLGEETSFTNTTTNVGSDPDLNVYSWVFGDGGTSSDPNPGHTYLNDSTFRVELTVTDNWGCRQTDTSVFISPVPLDPRFNLVADTVCQGINVTFENLSEGAISKYRWDFDGDHHWDLETTDKTNPVFMYPARGSFLATLEVESANGCKRIFSLPMRVTQSTADFSTLQQNIGCAAAYGNFEALVEDSDVKSYSWDFGDGNSSTERNPRNHLFTLPGFYTISLTVTFHGGCSFTVTKPNYIFVDGAFGVFSYNKRVGCAPNTVELKVSEMNKVSTITWDYGNGDTDSEPVTMGQSEIARAYTYLSPDKTTPFVLLSHPECGTYPYGNTNLGYISTSTPPVAAFNASTKDICQGVPIQFSDASTSTDPDFEVTQWTWIFPDDTISGIQNPSHAFPAASYPQVKLIASSSAGCSDTVVVGGFKIYDKTNLQISFSIDDPLACPGQALTFTSQTHSDNGAVTSLIWKYGDGVINPQNQTTTTHSYSYDKKGYSIPAWLVASDDKQCTDSTFRTVNINKLQATLEYDPQPVFRGMLVDFSSSNSTSDFGTTINKWQWDFYNGSGQTSALQNPTGIGYPVIGDVFGARLIVSNDNLCRDTAYVDFPVLNNPPEVSSFEITFLTSTQYQFKQSEFEQHYQDKDSPDQTFQAIRIETLPLNAVLKLNGTELVAGQLILYSDLNNLTIEAIGSFTGLTGFLWSGYDGTDFSTSAEVRVNIAPYPDPATLQDLMIQVYKDETVTLSRSQFNDHYNTTGVWESLRLTHLTVLTLPDPQSGYLVLNGQPVTQNQTIDSVDIEWGDGLQFIPEHGFGGDVVFRWTARDAYNDADGSARVVITYLNHRPEISDIIRENLVEDQILNLSMQDFLDQFSDQDRYDQPVTFMLHNLPSSVQGVWWINGIKAVDGAPIQFDQLSQVSFSPSTGFEGNTIVEWIVSDGMDTDTALIRLSYVNTPPVVHTVRFDGFEDTPLRFASNSFVGKYPNGPFEDPDKSDAFKRIRIVSLPEHGQLTIFENPLLTVPADTSYTWINNLYFRPDENWNGLTYFLYNGFDGTDWASEPDTVFIFLEAVNDPPVAVADQYTIDEDQLLTGVSAIDNDSDVDNSNEQLRAHLVDGGTAILNGTLALSSDGIITYQPDPDFNGEVTFTYQVCDPGLLCSEATVTIKVNPVNDVPAVSDDQFEVYEDDGKVILDPSVLSNDKDVDGDLLRVTLLNGDITNPVIGKYGTLEWSSDGYLIYTLNQLDTLEYDERVSERFEYTATDGSLDASAFITLVIVGENDRPVANPDRYLTTQNDQLIKAADEGVLVNDTDIDGKIYSVSLMNESADNPTDGLVGFLNWQPDGSFVYSPDERALHLAFDDTLTETFYYRIIDEYDSLSLPSTITIRVAGLNDAPVAVNDSLTFYESSRAVVIKAGTYPALLVNDDDVDDNDYPYVISVNGDILGEADGLTGVLRWDSAGAFTYISGDTVRTLAEGMIIYDYYHYTISDLQGAIHTATLVITIIGENDPPAAVDDELEILEDQHFSSVAVENGMLSNDKEIDGDRMVASINGETDGLITGRYGVLSWDSLGGYTYTTIIERVDSLNRSQIVEDRFVYTATDSLGLFDSANLIVRIFGQNDRPTVSDKREAITEDDISLIRSSRESGLLRNDSDIDGDEFGLIEVKGSDRDTTDGRYGQLVWSWDGTFMYSPYSSIHSLKQNEVVIDTFCYSVKDQFPVPGYEASDSVASACVFIEITGINDAPVAYSDTIFVSEDETDLLEFKKAGGYILSNDTDVEEEPIEVISLGGEQNSPVEGRFCTLGWDAGGDLTYQRSMTMQLDTLPLGSIAIDSLQYIISDTLGAKASAWVYIVMKGENDPPVAVCDTDSIYEDQMRINRPAPGLLKNDWDIDRGDVISMANDEFFFVGQYGVLTLGTGGAWQYDIRFESTDSLAYNQRVTDKFIYRIKDLNGAFDNDTLIITVIGVNDAPVAQNDTLMMTEETESIEINVLENDGDVDGEDPVLIRISGDTLKTVIGQYGVLNWTPSGQVVYTPKPEAVDSLKQGDRLTETFEYTIADSRDATATAFILVMIEGQNDAPQAHNVFVSIGEKTENIVVSVTDTLSLLNPRHAFDVDGDSLSVLSINGLNQEIIEGEYGQLYWQPDGSFSFINNLEVTAALAFGDTVIQKFTFTVTDHPFEATASAEILIEIIGVNDPPVANPVYYQTLEYTAIEKTVASGEHILNNDYDVDSHVYSISEVEQLPGKKVRGLHGTLNWEATGAFTYLPDTIPAMALRQDEKLFDTFEYTLEDDWAATDTSKIFIAIIGQNNPPEAYSDTIYVKDSKTPVVYGAPGLLRKAKDYDINDQLEISQVDGSTNGVIPRDYGTLEWDSTGRIVFIPDFSRVEQLGPSQQAKEIFPFTVSDEAGATDEARLYVIIVGMNSPLTALDTLVHIYEDSYLLIGPGTEDPDNNGAGNIDSTSIKIIGKPRHGTGSANTSTFRLFYRPEKDFVGLDSIHYSVCDLGGSCDDGWIVIDVLPVNDPPLGMDTVINVLEGQTVSFDPFSRVSDPDDGINQETLKISVAPQYGKALIEKGIFSYEAFHTSEDFDEVVYQVNDYAGDSVFVIVSVNILHQSELFAQNDQVETPEDSPVTFEVLLNDTLGGRTPDPLSFGIKLYPKNGSVLVNPTDRSLTYIPFENFCGQDRLIYTICATDGVCDQAEVFIKVSPVNDPLTANDDAAFTMRGISVNVAILDNDYDQDGEPDPQSVKIEKPINGTTSYNPATGLVTYKPNLNFKGIDFFSYSVCDNDPEFPSCDTAFVTIYVGLEPFNIFAVNDYYTLPVNQERILENPHPLDNDSVKEGSIDAGSFKVIQMPWRGSYDRDSNRYQPETDFWGHDIMKYIVCDTDTSCDMADINLWIEPSNLPPVANNDFFTLIGNRPNRLLVLGNDFDKDGYLLNSSVQVIGAPANGLVTVDPNTGSLLYEPAINKGTDSLLYQVCDNEGACSSAKVNLEIDLGRNLFEKRSTLEDTPDTLNLPEILAMINLFVPVSGIDTLVAPLHGTISLIQNGTRLVYLPDPDYNGPDYFKVKLVSTEASDIVLTVDMTVIPVNDAPVAVDDTITWNEAGDETSILFLTLLHNDYDVDDDPLLLTRHAVQVGFDGLRVTFNADSTINLKADSMQWCNAWFSYRIDDPDSLYSIARVWIWPVLKPEDLIANDDHSSVEENSSQNIIDVLANDVFKDGQRCVIDTIEILQGPFHGSAATTSDNFVLYTPGEHYYTHSGEQPDSILYRITNIWGQQDSAWLYIEVIQKNTPPVANNDVVNPVFGERLNICVLNNDYDPDPDGYIDTTATRYTAPLYGQLSYDLSSGCFVYIPTVETCESDSFSYTIADNEGGMASAIVTIEPPSEAPLVAAPDTVRTYPGIRVELNPLENDEGFFIPVIDDYSQPGHGSLIVGADNWMTYSPDPDFVGRDSLTYSIITPCGNSSSALVIFLVEELRVPEIITPNGDTKNDELIIDGIEYYPESIFEIYNRYGHIVYSMRGYDNSWNGYSNKGNFGGNQPLPTSTYYYVLKYNQGRNKQTGIIYLFR